ncbi:MAG: NYN domain-containing protein [Anaerolineae bacterium]
MLEDTQEVALFINFNDIRRGYTRTYGCEPEPLELMQKARAYGRVVTATAYADFTEHPSRLRRALEVAGILPRDIPKRNSGSGKFSASMVMLMDVVDCLLDRPNVDVYVLMTDSSDFIRIVTRARHRFAKTVIVAGVPGLVSQDLIESADGVVPLIGQRVAAPARATEKVIAPIDLPEGVSQTEARLIQLIDYLERNRPYVTFSFIHSYAVNPIGRLRLRDVEASDLLDRFVEDGLLIPFEKRLGDGRIVVNVRLNYSHPLSQQLVRQPAKDNFKRHQPATATGRQRPA